MLKTTAEKNELLAAEWDPHRNYKATDNAYHTLFVARLAYETTEKKLRREFEQFGPIKNIQMVLDNDGKPRGYAFVEFEREEDMTNAYKRADGRKIDGKRIIVDVERGRSLHLSLLTSSLSLSLSVCLSAIELSEIGDLADSVAD